ncbi:MAG: nitrate ABC transporter permease [Eubacteriales bacterium]|nr:nitrate ABC transporter permease [Eubacteriales bacterium]
MNKLPDWFQKTAIILFWLALWQLASGLIHNRILLVGPLETLKTLAGLSLTLSFWKAVGFSFCRISLGFFLAFFAGILTGALSCWKPAVGAFLAPPIQFMKSIPVASFVILALIWAGSRNLSVCIAFVVVYPVIHINTVSGLCSADPMLLEMAGVFRVPLHRKALFIYRIFLGPYLVSACKTALGMAFKSGIAAEVIGVPGGSIGEGLYQAKIYLSTGELFAWTLTIILISAAFEKIFLLFLQKLTRTNCRPPHKQ